MTALFIALISHAVNRLRSKSIIALISLLLLVGYTLNAAGPLLKREHEHKTASTSDASNVPVNHDEDCADHHACNHSQAIAAFGDQHIHLEPGLLCGPCGTFVEWVPAAEPRAVEVPPQIS